MAIDETGRLTIPLPTATATGIRRVGAALIAAAAIAVWFFMAPAGADELGEVRDRAASIEAVMDDNADNEANADSAPQQQVTNGWVTRDLLEVIAEQQNDIALRARVQDDRPAALLALGVLGVALGLATSPVSSRS